MSFVLEILLCILSTWYFRCENDFFIYWIDIGSMWIRYRPEWWPSMGVYFQRTRGHIEFYCGWGKVTDNRPLLVPGDLHSEGVNCIFRRVWTSPASYWGVQLGAMLSPFLHWLNLGRTWVSHTPAVQVRVAFYVLIFLGFALPMQSKIILHDMTYVTW